jgi:CubicO group peptidase (beta-lactamase class C family)
MIRRWKCTGRWTLLGASLVFASAALSIAIGAQTDTGQAPAKLDLSKVNYDRVLLDKYSYMNQPYSFYYFHHMNEVFSRKDWVHKPATAYPLREPVGQFTISYSFGGAQHTLDEYYQRNSVLGLLVLKSDQVVLEKYLHGATPTDRFLSNSVAKSLLSVLFGVAIEQGKVHSVHDHVIDYLPYLKNSGYRDTTIQDLLEMASGVKFNENYLDPKAEVQRLQHDKATGAETYSQLAMSLTSMRKPGTHFEYQSINTAMLGVLLEKATGEPLARYMQENLWQKIGASSDAFIGGMKAQPEVCAFGCFNATLRDYGRFGLMMLQDGTLGGQRVISPQWVKESTTPGAAFLKPKSLNDFGYAYQWWIPGGDEHEFEAMGIYGQMIYVNPTKHVVIVQTSAWQEPDSPESQWDESLTVFRAIAKRVAATGK